LSGGAHTQLEMPLRGQLTSCRCKLTAPLFLSRKDSGRTVERRRRRQRRWSTCGGVRTMDVCAAKRRSGWRGVAAAAAAATATVAMRRRRRRVGVEGRHACASGRRLARTEGGRQRWRRGSGGHRWRCILAHGGQCHEHRACPRRPCDTPGTHGWLCVRAWRRRRRRRRWRRRRGGARVWQRRQRRQRRGPPHGWHRADGRTPTLAAV
jgi:hypothetical protein